MPESPAPQYAGRPIVFTFLDGQFCYDCAACDGICCQVVPGLFVTAAQTGLLEQLDSGASVVSLDADRTFVKFNERGCPALCDDHGCAIHRDQGRRAKPPVCALFPFVKLVNAGSFLTASPHLNFICPLTLGEGGTGHGEILEDLEVLHGGGIGGFVHEDLPTEDPVDADLEERFVTLANQGCGQATVADVVCETGVDRQHLEERVEVAFEMLDLRTPEETPETAAPLLPLIPSLRPDLFRLPRTELATALVVTARLIAHANRVRQVPLSIRQMASYWETRQELLALLVVAHRPVSLGDRQPIIERGTDEVSNILAALVEQITDHPGRRSLAEWIQGTPRGTVRHMVLNSLIQLVLSFE